jgi:hypothetical protein
MVLVNRMNHLFRVPLLSSLVDSAHPTLPAGYSPVGFSSVHVARKHLYRVSRFTSNADTDLFWSLVSKDASIEGLGSGARQRQLTKNLHATSMLNMPTVSPCQYEPAARAVKIIRITVEVRRAGVRPQASETKPNSSWPTTCHNEYKQESSRCAIQGQREGQLTVPAKAMEATFCSAVELV